MINTLRDWLHRVTRRPSRASAVGVGASARLEPLEERVLMAGGPRVASIVADNRGLIVITLDRAVNPATVNTRSVQVYTTSAGRSRRAQATVAYSARQRRITVDAALKADMSYKVYLSSKLIKGADGAALDGEFKGASKPSGDGVPGGDCFVAARTAPQQIARFSTVFGNIDVRLFSSQTLLTVQNFLRYANSSGNDAEYSYDGTFFHRSVGGSAIYGGGYRVTPDNRISAIYQRAAVPNEARPGDPGNVRGTIAMAKLGANPNSATNQWFFNVADNRESFDTQNGGVTVFGQITSSAGMRVMDKIAALKLMNLQPGNPNTPFSMTPAVNADKAIKRGTLDPKRDLVIVKRVAVLMAVQGVPAKG